MKNLFTFQNTLLFFSKVHPLGTYRMNFDAKITALLFCSAFFFNTTSFAQSSTCIPGNVENAGESSWSEECYLNDECLEQGNPCQANDVKMLGAYIADLSGGPINTFIPGTTVTFALWGAFYNNTGTNRYAVRSRTEFYKNGLLEDEANACSFDVMPSGNSNAILLDGFAFQSGELVQLLNTWVGWSTTAAQCTEPTEAEYKSVCGEYPPAKCSKELGFIEILAPNFSHACGNTTASTVEVCFTNLSAGGTGTLVYNWDFGDGNSSNDESPCHVYNVVNGEFTCLLEVTDDVGVVAAAQALINLEELDCCSLIYECPPGFAGIMQCVEEIPAASPEAIEIIESCGPVSVTYLEELAGAGCPGDPVTLTRTYIISDDVSTETCTQSYTVSDLVQPSLICPADITVSCAELVPEPDINEVIAEENCEGATIVTFVNDVIANEICENEYQIIRTYQAEDECGNISTCAQTITVLDNIAPAIACPANITVTCAANIPAANVEAIIATDNCAGDVEITVAADAITQQTCANQYLISRIYTATDLCGNTSSCVQIITVLDNMPPSITCPANLTVSCEADVPETNTAAIITSDNCGGPVTIIASPDIITNQACDNEYTISRLYTATDLCGNTSSCIQTITVADNLAPSITCMADVTVSCAEDLPAADISAIVVTDNCGVEGDVTVTVASDVITNLTCDNAYVITRIYTATDACGNTSSCVQTITVADNIAPSITCLADVTVSCAGDVPAADISAIVVTDNCGVEGDITVTVAADVITNLTCDNEYVITRVYTVTDACGNIATCAQTITVADNIAPSITCLADVTVSCAGGVPAADISAIVVTDNCGVEGDITVAVAADVITNLTCDNEYVITRVYTATDACGNIATCAQTITVADNTAPSITCIADITVSCSDNIPAADISAIVATDNCGGEISIDVMPDITVNQTCANSFTIQRTYVATDVCGNTASCVQNIVVDDNIAPTITCQANITVSCSGDVPPVDVNSITTTDNCSGMVTVAHVSDIVQNLTCENNFTVIRTYSASDDCGNSVMCSQTITVSDQSAPTVTCSANVNVDCASDVPPVDIASVSFTDNCGGEITVAHVSDVITNQTCANRFLLTRTYSVTDDCGNSATCAQQINVYDSLAPTIALIDPLLDGLNDGDTLYVQCYGQDPEWDVPDFSEASASATDNCDGTVTLDHSSALVGEGDCAADGFIVMYRHVWTAGDACGNTDSTIIFVTLIDTIAPVIVGVPEDVTVNWDSIPALPNLFATDECLCACVILLEETPIDSSICLDGQVITRTWKATDACGNMAIETQNITLIDADGPQLLFLEPDLAGVEDGAILEFTCAQGGIPSFFNELNTESMLPVDGSGPVAITFNENLVEPINCEFSGFLEEQSFSWSALDQCGNAASLTITARLTDDVAPAIVGLPDYACVADPILNDIEAFDDCGEASLRYFDDQIDSPCSEGLVTMRTYEAIDECGNMISDTVILLPDDQARPVLEFINPDLMNQDEGDTLVVNCSAENGQHTPYGIQDVIVTDACSETVQVSFHENMIAPDDCTASGSLGLMELEWIAIDVCGNSTSVSRIARVVDNTVPVFENFEKEVTIACNDDMPHINALDNCGEVRITTIDSIIPGDCAYEYDVIRTITATDGCNNSASQKQMVHVGDNSGPDILGVEPIVCDDLSMPEITAFDPCAGVFVNVTMTEDTLETICRDGLIIERIWTATDACQNVAEVHQQIIIGDDTAPEIMVPTYSIIYDYMDLDFIPEIMISQTDIIDQLNTLDAGSVSVFDDCDEEIDPDFSLIINQMTDDEGAFERRTYTWIATDHCGNSSSVDFTIDIIDDTPPVLELPGDTVVICSPLPPAPEMILDDSTAIVEYTEVIENGPNPGEFIVTRTWIVTDQAGNSSVTVQKIKWIPDTFLECEIVLPDSVECNSHGVIITSVVTGGFEPYTYLWEIEGDECFIQGGQNTPEITIYVGWSDVNIKLTVIDAYGCVTTCTAVLSCDPALNGLIIGSNNHDVYENDIINQPESFTFKQAEGLINANLWPNPTNGDVNLTFESSMEQELELTLTNFVGQKVMTHSFRAIKGKNIEVINASSLPDGSYLMQVKTDNEVYTEVLVIMRD